MKASGVLDINSNILIPCAYFDMKPALVIDPYTYNKTVSVYNPEILSKHPYSRTELVTMVTPLVS